MASKVRINLANEQELMELPGLDPAQAAAIVRFRSEHGPIESEGSLARVLGRPIGEDVRTRVDFSPSAGTAPEAPGA
jgi:competence protein ComEA